jgi:hypothetical protein
MGGFQFLLRLSSNQPLCRAIKGVIKSMGWFSVPFRDDLQAFKGEYYSVLAETSDIITDFDCHHSLMLTVIITDFDCHHH